MKRSLHLWICTVVALTLAFPLSAGALTLDETLLGADGTPLSQTSTIAGAGDFGDELTETTAEEASFRFPEGVLVLNNGVILVADTKNHRIKQIKGGKVSPYAGFDVLPEDEKGLPVGTLLDGEMELAVFHEPRGMAADQYGNIYVADSLNHAIRKIDPKGNVTTIAGDGVLGNEDGNGQNARFYQPSDVAAAKDGTIYVADTLNHVIRKISPSGQVTTLNAPSDRIIEIIDGYPLSAGDYKDGNLSEAKFNEPYGLALDDKGNLYVADSGNHRIRYIDLQNNTVITVAGPKTVEYGENELYAEAGYNDVASQEALFHFPKGIAWTAEGGLVIADSMNHAIRYLFDGKVITLTGNGTNGNENGIEGKARFHAPTDVTISSEGNLFIADAYNNKIRMYQPYQLPALSNSESVNVVYENELVNMDTLPEITNGRTMVPVRAVAEQMGYQVHYDTESQTVSLIRGNIKLTFVIGSNLLEVQKDKSNITQLTIDTAPYRKLNRVYVPIRFFSEAFGYDVKWDAKTGTVIIR